MRESDIQNAIRLALNPYGRFFRINTGSGWTGNDIKQIARDGMIRVQAGDVVISHARPFSTGTPPGFSDVIGAVPLTVTREHIGRRIAVFSTIEVKTKTGRVEPEQTNFLDVMSGLGCMSGIARSPEDAIRIVRGL